MSVWFCRTASECGTATHGTARLLETTAICGQGRPPEARQGLALDGGRPWVLSRMDLRALDALTSMAVMPRDRQLGVRWVHVPLLGRRACRECVRDAVDLNLQLVDHCLCGDFLATQGSLASGRRRSDWRRSMSNRSAIATLRLPPMLGGSAE